MLKKIEINIFIFLSVQVYPYRMSTTQNIPSLQHVAGTRKNILGLRRVLDNLGVEIGKATLQAIYLDESGYVPADLRRDTSLKYRIPRWTPHPPTIPHHCSKYITESHITVVPAVATAKANAAVPALESVVSLQHVVGTRKNIKGLRRVLDNAGYGTDAHMIAVYLDENGIVPAYLRRRQDLLIRYRAYGKWLSVSDVRKFKYNKNNI